MFEIQNKLYKALMGLVLLSFPAVAANLGYMGGSGFNFIGILICIIAAYLTCDAIHNDFKLNPQYWMGSLLFACSLGEYQCYFSLYLSVCLLYCMSFVLQHSIPLRKFYRYFGYYVLNIFVGVVLYIIVLQGFLWFENVKLLHYANTDTYGAISVYNYLERFYFSYNSFFYPHLLRYANMFPFQWNGWYRILILLIVFLCALYVVTNFQTEKRETRLQFYVLLVLVPCIFNFNIVIYGWVAYHALHVYHYSLLFLLPVILFRTIAINQHFRSHVIIRKAIKAAHIILIFCMFIFGCLFVRYDNYCYMLSEFRLSQAICYYTALTARIMSVNNYKQEYPVAFVNENKKNSNADKKQEEYDFPVINPYNTEFVNSYPVSSRAFMKYWCGYSPEFVNAKQYEKDDIVKSMPSYPDDGSIKIIDNVIVVKF